jgi:CRISPR/Cas system CSM-associated protein Csm3 (group 7 of RAMP superfamily)
MAMEFERISITYNLTFKTPFHCGTGLRAALIDRTVVRDRDEYLYVPGSTIKGVVREHCERLEYMYSPPTEEESAQAKEGEQIEGKIRTLIRSPHDAGQALPSLGRHITIISRIFGSHYHPGYLFFEDAHQSDEEKKLYRGAGDSDGYKSLQTDLYTQVRLHRTTRTAVAGALYTSEFGIKDIALQGKIKGWLQCIPIGEIKPERVTYSLLLLLAGLHMLDRIGGNKSTGKGKCCCEVTSVEIGEQAYTKEQWQSWFKHLDMLAKYQEVAAAQKDEGEEEL